MHRHKEDVYTQVWQGDSVRIITVITNLAVRIALFMLFWLDLFDSFVQQRIFRIYTVYPRQTKSFCLTWEVFIKMFGLDWTVHRTFFWYGLVAIVRYIICKSHFFIYCVELALNFLAHLLKAYLHVFTCMCYRLNTTLV